MIMLSETCIVERQVALMQIYSLCWIPISGLAWSLYKCASLWRAVYGPSATERRPGTICEEKGTASWIWVSILSQYDLRAIPFKNTWGGVERSQFQTPPPMIFFFI